MPSLSVLSLSLLLGNDARIWIFLYLLSNNWLFFDRKSKVFRHHVTNKMSGGFRRLNDDHEILVNENSAFPQQQPMYAQYILFIDLKISNLYSIIFFSTRQPQGGGSFHDKWRPILRNVFSHLHFDIGIIMFVLLYTSLIMLEMIINLDVSCLVCEFISIVYWMRWEILNENVSDAESTSFESCSEVAASYGSLHFGIFRSWGDIEDLRVWIRDIVREVWGLCGVWFDICPKTISIYRTYLCWLPFYNKSKCKMDR